MKLRATLYKRHRFPPEIIQHAVWLYHRFNVSHRDTEDLLVRRGIVVSLSVVDANYNTCANKTKHSKISKQYGC